MQLIPPKPPLLQLKGVAGWSDEHFPIFKHEQRTALLREILPAMRITDPMPPISISVDSLITPGKLVNSKWL